MELENSHVAQGPSRIVVAADHPLFRSAIRHTLEAHRDLKVVAEAANGQEAVELCRSLRPELVSLRTSLVCRGGRNRAKRRSSLRAEA
jgi:DNA-binding NarL/FixJ family response regulator